MVTAKNMTSMKKQVKEDVEPSSVYRKVFIVQFKLDEDSMTHPLTMMMTSYTLTPKNALLIKDTDKGYTVWWSPDEIEEYGFNPLYVKSMISNWDMIHKTFKKLGINANKTGINVSELPFLETANEEYSSSDEEDNDESSDEDIHGGSLKGSLIRKIPHDTYNEKDIHKIVKLIRNGTITDEAQFPLPSKTGEKKGIQLVEKEKPESESDEEQIPEFKPEFTKFGNLTALSKDKLNTILSNTDGIDFKVRASIRNAIKNNKCKSVKEFEMFKPKEKKAPPPKPVKKVKPSDPYYGIPPVPKGKHQASMLEASKAKQIKYWGVKKVDSKILDSMVEKPKEKKIDLQIKLSGLKGKLTRLKREFDKAETLADKQAKGEEFKACRAEAEALTKRISNID